MNLTTSVRILLRQSETMTELQVRRTVDSAIISDTNGDPAPLQGLIRIANLDNSPVTTSQELIRKVLIEYKKWNY